MEDTNRYVELLNDSCDSFKTLKDDIEIQKRHLEFLIDKLGNVTDAMESLKSAVTKSESRRVWANDAAYQRILEILEDYWITQPNEESVEVTMCFRRSEYDYQEKHIIWRNPNLVKESK